MSETLRLATLHRYGVLDTPPEAAFDRLARLAADLFGAPVALVSFVDAERQWIKAHYGLDVRETPRSAAFCDHTIRGDCVLVVPDATRDPRFCENPLVTGAPDIRFYAGAPLTTADGVRLGSLCVIDYRPRPRPPQAALDRLAALAAVTVDLLDFRRASIDALTESLSRGRLLLVDDLALNRELGRALLERAGFTVETADSGEAALARVQVAAFDVILMDVQMPGMNGVECTRRLRTLAGAPARTPVLGFTAIGSPAVLRECFAAGMDDHIGKPVVPAELIGKVTAWVGRTSSAHAAAEAMAEPMKRLTAVFLDELAASRHGLEADRRRLAAGDAGSISNLAQRCHDMAGSAGLLGQGALAQAAAAAERAARAGHVHAAAVATMALLARMDEVIVVRAAA